MTRTLLLRSMRSSRNIIYIWLVSSNFPNITMSRSLVGLQISHARKNDSFLRYLKGNMFTVSSLLCLSIARSLSSAASHLNGPTAHGPCKTTPNSTNWPSQAQWNTLNASIAGQLLAPLPPAAVCDRSLSVYDSTSCASVASQYTSSDFHARDPVSVDEPNWENDACLPDSTHACDVKQFPVYVVNATVSAQVQAAVNFGRLHNVRLIVKGTGHDYLGR